MKSIVSLLIAFIALNTSVNAQGQSIGLNSQSHNGAGCSTGTLSVVALVVASGTCGPVIGRTNPMALPGNTNTTYDYNQVAAAFGWDIDPNPPSLTNQWEYIAAYVYTCDVPSYTSGPTGTNGACGNNNEDWVLVGHLSCFSTDNDCMTYSTSNCGCSSGETANVWFSPGGLGLSYVSVDSN